MSAEQDEAQDRPSSWTEERVEQLRTLWADGLSASQIAKALGEGVTRNAVIGKVHRLGLSGRISKSKAAPRPRRAREPSQPPRHGSQPQSAPQTHGATALKAQPRALAEPRPAPEPVPLRLLEMPKGERVNILMLTDRTCRWPIGDPGTEDFCFCGSSPKQGLPYCEYHARMAYQPVNDRRRERHAARG